MSVRVICLPKLEFNLFEFVSPLANKVRKQNNEMIPSSTEFFFFFLINAFHRLNFSCFN